ncbi:MAG TPA: hypothetical protein VFO35_07855, partial [Steroidobacteraceae bacterium]|nr:hypothetical protein [Steroidobacteraceae bacterium]
MYQIQTWRYWLVGIVVAAALLLSTPSFSFFFFGEDPSIQLAREDRAAITADAQTRVEGILREQKIPPTSAYLEEGRLLLRFSGQDEQLKA